MNERMLEQNAIATILEDCARMMRETQLSNPYHTKEIDERVEKLREDIYFATLQ